MPPQRHPIDEAGEIEALGVHAAAVGQHTGERTLENDRHPDRHAARVQRDRYVFDLGAQVLERASGGANLRRHLGHRAGRFETLAQQPDTKAGNALGERGAIVERDRGGNRLSRIDAVRSRQHFQQQGVVGDGPGDRAGMIDADVGAHDPGIGHEAEGRLQADDAATRRRNPDRAALVAADCEVRGADRDGDGASGGRASRRMGRPVRIEHGAPGAGEARARRTEMLAPRLADDRCAGVEDAGDDGGVDFGHVALQDGGSIHHLHAGHADVVLDGDALAGELSRRRARNLGDDAPGVEGILVRGRLAPGRAGILHRRQFVGHRLQRLVGREARLH